MGRGEKDSSLFFSVFPLGAVCSLPAGRLSNLYPEPLDTHYLLEKNMIQISAVRRPEASLCL